ncbi:MAG: MFS transporter [Chloroflexi bacterium]|nr:MFS transporter [Chloroflexota bacterium]
MTRAEPGAAASDPQKPGEDSVVPGKKPKERFYGWNIVGASALLNGLGGSVHWQGFTVFFIPISQSLGLSSAQTAMPFALSRAENGIMGPITGILLDKYGVRRMMIFGTIMTGVGYIWLAQTSTFLAFLLVYLFVVSIGSSTSFMQASTTALNTWFSRRRGVVMSINSAAFRLGGAFMVPLLSVAVLRWGWETTALWVGVGMLVFITPLALFFRRSPESMGTGPDGDPLKQPAVISESGDMSSEMEDSDDEWTPRDAIRTRAFWTLAAGTVLRMSVHGTIFVHFVPILVWKGESQQSAANLIGLLALCSVPLILIFGWLSDRLGRQRLLFGCYLSAASSLALLNVVEGSWPIFVAMLLFTGTEIGSGLNWALVGDLFGRKRFATIRGMLSPIYNTALFAMPIAAGWVKDETGSYQIVLLVGTGLLIAAAFTFLTIKKPEHTASTVSHTPG